MHITSTTSGRHCRHYYYLLSLSIVLAYYQLATGCLPRQEQAGSASCKQDQGSLSKDYIYYIASIYYSLQPAESRATASMIYNFVYELFECMQILVLAAYCVLLRHEIMRQVLTLLVKQPATTRNDTSTAILKYLINVYNRYKNWQSSSMFSSGIFLSYD